MIEHLVVGEQDVRRRIVHEPPIGDQPVLRHHRPPARGLLTGVETGGHARQLRMLGDHSRQPLFLIVGQGVHRVDDQRLHPRHALPLGAQHMIEDRDQERLDLTRAGAGGDQGRLRAVLELGRQPLERLGLMAVGNEILRQPVQVHSPVAAGRGEREAEPDVRALEHALMRVADEVDQGGLGVRVGEREGGGEVVGQAFPQVVGLQGRQECPHMFVLLGWWSDHPVVRAVDALDAIARLLRG